MHSASPRATLVKFIPKFHPYCIFLGQSPPPPPPTLCTLLLYRASSRKSPKGGGAKIGFQIFFFLGGGGAMHLATLCTVIMPEFQGGARFIKGGQDFVKGGAVAHPRPPPQMKPCCIVIVTYGTCGYNPLIRTQAPKTILWSPL